MTLAEIIRAQLATGRPLRVTRALLEALDAGETDAAEARRTMLAMRRQRDDYADRLDAAQSRADERDIMRRERDEARVEVERLRAERDEASESLRLSVAAWDATGMQGRDAVSVIREAEERGAQWALDAADYEISGSAKSRELRATAASQGSAARARIEYGAEVAWSEAHRVAGMDAARICEAARKAGEHE